MNDITIYESQIKQALQSFIKLNGNVDTGKLLRSIKIEIDLTVNFPVKIKVISEDYIKYLDILEPFYNSPQLSNILEAMYNEVVEEKINQALIEVELNEEQIIAEEDGNNS